MGELVENIKRFNEQTKAFFDAINTVIDYITHPIKIWNGFIGVSYWILLIAAMCFMLIYLINSDKKQLERVGLCFGIYLITRIMDWCIRG